MLTILYSNWKRWSHLPKKSLMEHFIFLWNEYEKQQLLWYEDFRTIRDFFSFFLKMVLSKDWKIKGEGALFYTAQKMKFSIKDFFSKSDQIRGKLLLMSVTSSTHFVANKILGTSKPFHFLSRIAYTMLLTH